MIRISKRHSDKVVESYIKDICPKFKRKLYAELIKFSGAGNLIERTRLYSFCSFKNLYRQASLKPKDILNELLLVERLYPEVIEYYATSFFYRDALSVFGDKIRIAKTPDKITFDNNIDLLFSALTRIKSIHNKSCMVNHLISEVSQLQQEKNRLNTSSPRGILKDRVNSIVSLMKGLGHKAFFPLWVSSISNIYDYDSIMTQDLAMNIIESIGVEVCPYCNINVIKQDEKKGSVRRKYRPALDHYFPKSRYPFLSLSIYNLIPSCHECNSTRKADYDTYLNEYIYPYKLGFCSEDIFAVEDLDDLLLRKIHDRLESNDINLRCNLDRNLGRRLDLFELNYRYMNKINPREKIFPILQSFLDSNKGEVFNVGVNEYTQDEFIERNSSIFLNKPAIKQELKKLKIDVINQVYKTNYRV